MVSFVVGSHPRIGIPILNDFVQRQVVGPQSSLGNGFGRGAAMVRLLLGTLAPGGLVTDVCNYLALVEPLSAVSKIEEL